MDRAAACWVERDGDGADVFPFCEADEFVATGISGRGEYMGGYVFFWEGVGLLPHKPAGEDYCFIFCVLELLFPVGLEIRVEGGKLRLGGTDSRTHVHEIRREHSLPCGPLLFSLQQRSRVKSNHIVGRLRIVSKLINRREQVVVLVVRAHTR